MIWFYGWGCAPQVVLDFDATCVSEWPADTCSGNACADSDIEDRWVAAFEPAFAGRARIPESSVADYARVRSITDASGTFQSILRASWQADVDWVRLVREVELWTDGPSPGDGELADRWRERMAAESPGFRGRRGRSTTRV